MSLLQCQVCGSCDNTALCGQGIPECLHNYFDWSGIEDRKGKVLCSACAPSKHSDGTPTEYGQWHGKFTRVFLPLGMFKTNNQGNLEHKETGSADFQSYAIGVGL